MLRPYLGAGHRPGAPTVSVRLTYAVFAVFVVAGSLLILYLAGFFDAKISSARAAAILKDGEKAGKPSSAMAGPVAGTTGVSYI